MKRKNIAQFIFAATLFLIATEIGNAQTCPPLTAGCLDYTFGGGGTGTNTTYVTPNLSVTRAAMQSDGKILSLLDAHLNTGNSFTNVVIRYKADGTVDTSFGSNGFLYMNWNGANNSFANAYAIAVQIVETEERIIVAGSTKNAAGATILRVDRYTSNGIPDTSFGTGGSAVVNAGYAQAVAVQSDGKILTMSEVGALVRLTVNGTLDTTFGSGGIVQSSVLKASSLAVQSTGKILAGGYSTVKSKNVLTVVRFNANGSLDTSFGTAGKVTISFFDGGESSIGYTKNDALKIDGSGRILVTGSAARKNSSYFITAVARLTVNGQLDTTFDGDGKATVDFSGITVSPRNVGIQSADGKIVLIGVTNAANGSTTNLGMIRFNPNGTLDTTFGQGGLVVSDYSSAAEWGYSGMIQFDPSCDPLDPPFTNCEKIVVVGTAENGGIDYAVAARYLQ